MRAKLPSPPKVPWITLEAAMRESEYVTLLATGVTPSSLYESKGSDAPTVRPKRST